MCFHNFTATIYLYAIVHPESSWRTFLTKKDRLGVSKKILEKFVTNLTYDQKQYFEHLNQDLKWHFIATGKATLGETMWAWLSDHPGIIDIERKPDSHGWKVLSLAFKLTATNR